MKHSEIEIARQLETPVDNPVQANLRRALELLDGGNNHIIGDFQDSDGRMCMWGALNVAAGLDVVFGRTAAHGILTKVTGSLGICGFNNSRSWSEIEAAFYHAIELAA